MPFLLLLLGIGTVGWFAAKKTSSPAMRSGEGLPPVGTVSFNVTLSLPAGLPRGFDPRRALESTLFPNDPMLVSWWNPQGAGHYVFGGTFRKAPPLPPNGMTGVILGVNIPFTVLSTTLERARPVV
jgi:hypothetical protein